MSTPHRSRATAPSFFFQAEDGIRDIGVTGVQTCALPICDGHDHWHVQRFERYLLIPLDPEDQGIENTRGSKIGFCFLDTNPWDRSLPGAPQSPKFFESGCGRASSTRLRFGISVGWADRYGYYLPKQYFDTTGLPYGDYLVCNTADASGH